MKTLLLCAAFAVAGCGLHDHSSEAKFPEATSKTDFETGPFNSKSDTANQETSDYEDCLREQGAHPNAKDICDAFIEARRPDKTPTTRYNPYGYNRPYGW